MMMMNLNAFVEEFVPHKETKMTILDMVGTIALCAALLAMYVLVANVEVM